MRVTARRLARASALLAAGCPATALASDRGEEAAALAARLQALRERVEAAENGPRTAAPRVAPAQAVTGGAFPGSWKLPGSDTSISFGGYVRLDAFATLGASADGAIGDSFVLSAIPVDNSAAARQGGDVRLHARNTRLRFDSRTPTEWGALQTRLEGDFFGAGGNQRFSNSAGFRLRQAYGVLGPVLAGQAQSTFMDADTASEMIDNFGPAGDSNLRQAQIRYTVAPTAALGVDAALENPDANVSAPTGAVNANHIDKLPDAVLRLRYRDSWGAVNLSGVVRRFAYDNGAGASDGAWGGGVHLGATVNTWGKDNFKFNVNFGPGLGRYIRTTTGSPELNVTCAGRPAATFVAGCGADITVNTAYGGWAQYQHWWSDSLRSNLLLGYMHADVDVAALGAGANGLTRNVQSALLNLIWTPLRQVSLGLEVMYGWRYLARAAAGTERSGQAGRIQAGFRYDF